MDNRLLIVFLICLLQFSLSSPKKTYIIHVQKDLKPTIFLSIEDWYTATIPSLTSPLGSPNPTTHQKGSRDLLHTYKTAFHGFSTQLTPQQVEDIKTRPGVIGVYPDQVYRLQTTRSPEFLGLIPNPKNSNNILVESDYGSNVIIAIIDGGIWPERRSFHDQGLGPVPNHWKGECVEGRSFSKNICNKKLIGARSFFRGYESYYGPINDTLEFRSPRDSHGHGTHTASIAAGRNVKHASFFGHAKGVASGIAPKARLAIYKICWQGSHCLMSDVLAGIDSAVEDGVNVISISIDGSRSIPYYIDPIAMASFGAMERGIFVSSSAGNEGPGERTVNNLAPWITTVGAGTIDRSFPVDLLLENGIVITGASLYSGTPLTKNKFFPLVYARNLVTSSRKNASSSVGGFYTPYCYRNTLDPEFVRGKIVLCDDGGIVQIEKGVAVKEAGGIGMIIINGYPNGEEMMAEPHFLPALQIPESAGYTLHAYIASSKNPQATLIFHGTRLGVKPAPMVASFSSRGPNIKSPYILKPDLIAPGAYILAAWIDNLSPTRLPYDPRRTKFNILSGTSMSCPHISGLAALLKGVHPEWSPAMIRSALMTTAYMHDQEGKPLLDEWSHNVSTVWDTGAGHVDPQKAVDPGLVLDLTIDDYLDFLCASNYNTDEVQAIAKRPVKCKKKGLISPSNLNYPAISVLFEDQSASSSSGSQFKIDVTRTLMQVSEGTSHYTVKIDNPKQGGVVMTVEPSTLNFRRKEQKQSFVLKISARKVDVPLGNYKSVFGRITWSDGKHEVRMPIALTWGNISSV